MVVVVVAWVPTGDRAKEDWADEVFQRSKRRGVGVSGRHENLADYHEHAEKEDEVGFRDGEPVSLLQSEEDCAIQTGLCREGHMKNFVCFRLPDPTQQLLKVRHQGHARTFEPSCGHHDEPAVVVEVVGVVHPGRDLAHPNHLLHGHQDELHGQEADTLVKEVHGTEEYQVPHCCGQDDTGVVAEVGNGCLSQQQISQDVAPKAVEHSTEPGGKRALPGHLHGSRLVLEVEDGDDEIGGVEQREHRQRGEGGRQLPEGQRLRQIHRGPGARLPVPVLDSQPRPGRPGPGSAGRFTRIPRSPDGLFWRKSSAKSQLFHPFLLDVNCCGAGITGLLTYKLK